MQGEAIYKGATRPAMKLGIPLVPLVVLFSTGMLLIMWGGTLVSWWIALGVVVAFVPALLWMRFVTSKDDQRFRQMFVAMKLRLHDRNRRFWHARSYAPKHILARSDEAAKRSIELQSRAMADAARVAFGSDLGAALQRLQSLHERPGRRWEPWLTHAAAAATASAATWTLAVTLWGR
jgi:type IV secretion system protein VirB3